MKVAEASLGRIADGAVGPDFAPFGPLFPDSPTWNGWRERLPNSPGRVAEGGLRLEAGRPCRQDAPLVSYITVTRNAAATLPRCLASLRAQTYPHVEHILVDGASEDGTPDIIQAHAEQLDYYVSEPDGGIYDAMNKALTLALGDYICVLNADDWLEPDAASIAVRHLAPMPEKAMLLSGVYRHGVRRGKERTRLWTPELLHPGFLFTPGRWCHNSLYASRALYESAGLFDASYRIVADYKWVARCLEARAHCTYTTEPTLHFTEGGMSADGVASARERLRVQREAFPFLTETEAATLCWSLTASLPEILPTPPRNIMQTLRDILCHHADQANFTVALTWALAAVCPHPAELPVTFRKRLSRSFRAGLKRLLPGKTR